MTTAFLPVEWIHAEAISELCHLVNDWAEKKGWNEDLLEGLEIPEDIRRKIEVLKDSSDIALIQSEASEALEYLRMRVQPAMDDKVPELTGLEAELADVCIRIFHFCGKRNINLGMAIKAKHEFNITRPYKHGKRL